MKFSASTILALTLLLPGGSVLAQEQACIYASQAYSIGYQGCFRRVMLECTDHNDWKERGSCASDTVPVGQAIDGLPDVFEGQLCNAGGYYSPDAEGCISGAYQICATDGQWKQRQPIDGAACP